MNYYIVLNIWWINEEYPCFDMICKRSCIHTSVINFMNMFVILLICLLLLTFHSPGHSSLKMQIILSKEYIVLYFDCKEFSNSKTLMHIYFCYQLMDMNTFTFNQQKWRLINNSNKSLSEILNYLKAMKTALIIIQTSHIFQVYVPWPWKQCW